MLSISTMAAAENAAVAGGPQVEEAAKNATVAGGSQVEEVVVTARKQQENLIQTPVTVTALTSAKIDALDLKQFKELAAYTPGVSIGGFQSIAGRFGNITVFRGMTPSISANASVFIDGTPVTSGVVDYMGDLARVELLKGPQTAYFGRSTFAGALNFVTKQPSSTLQGRVDATAGTDSDYDVRGSVEGTVIKDVLTARVAGRYLNSHGTQTNEADGSSFGNQETKLASIALHFTPTENFVVNAFGFVEQDEDGPAAYRKAGAPDFNCNAGATPGGKSNYICGTIPSVGAIPLGANEVVSDAFRNLVLNNSNGALNPLLKDQIQQKPGIGRHVYHGHVSLDYDAGFVRLTSLTSINYTTNVALFDGDNQDTRNLPPPAGANANASPYFNIFDRSEQYFYDWFQEFRITSRQHKRLRWMLGGSYAYSSTANLATFLNANGTITTGGLGAVTNTYTPAAFGSASLDIFDNLTLSVEGRYQVDKVRTYNRSEYKSLGAFIAGANFKKFTPRVILQYRPLDDTMIYASYAQGSNPGTFNTSPLAFSTAVQQKIIQQTGAGIAVQPEKLDNYELGVKSQFFDRRAQITAAVYYGVWSNQIVQQAFFDPTVLATTVNVNTNIGKTELKGVEIESEFRPTSQLSLNALFGYNGSDIKRYVCLACQVYAGANVNVIGHSLPRYSPYSAEAGVEYRDNITASVMGFGRIDYIYKSGEYADETNLAKTEAQNIVNIRVGAEVGSARVEGFITNLFNNNSPTSVVRATDNVAVGQSAFLLGLPELRRFGVRVTYKFGG